MRSTFSYAPRNGHACFLVINNQKHTSVIPRWEHVYLGSFLPSNFPSSRRPAVATPPPPPPHPTPRALEPPPPPTTPALDATAFTQAARRGAIGRRLGRRVLIGREVRRSRQSPTLNRHGRRNRYSCRPAPRQRRSRGYGGEWLVSTIHCPLSTVQLQLSTLHQLPNIQLTWSTA